MKYLFLILSTAIVSNYSFSQKKVHFGFEVAPNFSQGLLTNNGGDIAVAQAIANREISKFCLSGHAYAFVNLGSKTSLSLGVGYQNTGERTTKMPLAYGDMISPRGGWAPPIPTNGTTDVRYIYKRHNIQVPLLLKYNFASSFYVRGGVTTLFNFENSITLKKYNSTGRPTRTTNKETKTDYKPINLSGRFGIGYDLMKSQKMNLYIQTYSEIYFSPVKYHGSFNRTPLSLGLVIGAMI